MKSEQLLWKGLLTEMVDFNRLMLDELTNDVKLLSDWNKENINKDPEQVRKNIETLSNCFFRVKES